MVFALYKAVDNSRLDDFDSVVKTFARGNAEFMRWGFEKPGEFIPEIFSRQHGSLIVLQVENPRVTPFAENSEIQNMFAVLMHEVEPYIIATSSDDHVHLIKVEFPEMD